MNKFLNAIAIMLYLSCVQNEVSSQNECNCDVETFTISDPDKSANLYLKKDSFIVITMNFPYGNRNEDCIFFYTVDRCDDGWLRITDENSSMKYWIEPERLATTSNSANFNLYANASVESEVVFNSEKREILTIIGCREKWAQVVLRLEDGENVTGWLSPSSQCPNPFTICN